GKLYQKGVVFSDRWIKAYQGCLINIVEIITAKVQPQGSAERLGEKVLDPRFGAIAEQVKGRLCRALHTKKRPTRIDADFLLVADEESLREGGALGEEIGQMQFYLGLLLERREASQQAELIRLMKEIAIRPLPLTAKPRRRTVAESKLERVRLALDDFEVDVQRLVSGLGVERPRCHRLKHPQVVDRIGTGSEGFIAEALAFVDGQLTAY